MTADVINKVNVELYEPRLSLTQNDGGDFVVDRKNGDVQVVNRKCAVQGYGWGRGVSVTTALRPTCLAVRDDEGDGVEHRLRSDLSS